MFILLRLSRSSLPQVPLQKSSDKRHVVPCEANLLREAAGGVRLHAQQGVRPWILWMLPWPQEIHRRSFGSTSAMFCLWFWHLVTVTVWLLTHQICAENTVANHLWFCHWSLSCVFGLQVNQKSQVSSLDSEGDNEQQYFHMLFSLWGFSLHIRNSVTAC